MCGRRSSRAGYAMLARIAVVLGVLLVFTLSYVMLMATETLSRL